MIKNSINIEDTLDTRLLLDVEVWQFALWKPFLYCKEIRELIKFCYYDKLKQFSILNKS